MKKTNPNGANQYLLDPRQKECWDAYINPKSDTWSNAYKSAIKVGYEKTTALQITSEKWFIERVRRMNLLGKAEKVLEETLEIDHVIPAVGAFGIVVDRKTKQIVMEVSPAILKIKQDSAKFVAETQGKEEGYTKRSELTAKGGEALFDNESKEKSKKAISEFVGPDSL